MTPEQGAAIITILKCWLGASVLAGAAAAFLPVSLWLGGLLGIAAVVVAGIGLGTSSTGPTIGSLRKDH